MKHSNERTACLGMEADQLRRKIFSEQANVLLVVAGGPKTP